MTEIDISNIIAQKSNKSGGAKSQSWFDSLSSLLSKDINFNRNSFSDKKKEQLYNDLSILLSSGIDIRVAFEILEDNFQKKKEQEFIHAIYDDIVGGTSISEAFIKAGKFSSYECYSIQIGEETGRLNKVLSDLHDYFKKKIEQKRKITSVFMYPSIVISTAIIAVAFMLNFIVPMFEEIYKRFDKELPELTKFIIKLSHQSANIFMILIIIVIICFFIIQSMKRNNQYVKFRDTMYMKMPLFGPIIKSIQISRFCLSMELLLSAKLPLLNAIALVRNMITFYPLNSALKSIEHEITQGKPLYESMKSYPLFDKRMISLIKVGEEVNQLDKTFSVLKDQYQKEIDHKTGMISSVLEPVMIVFIGAFVAVILISMYLPIFKISTSFSV